MKLHLASVLPPRNREEYSYLGCLWLAGQLAKLLPKYLLVLDLEVLVAEEDNSSLRNCEDTQSKNEYRHQWFEPRIARSRILLSSLRILLTCRVGNSLPMTLVTSKDSNASRDPELCNGARADAVDFFPLIGREETGATSSVEIADGAIADRRDHNVGHDVGG